jgi:adenylyl-sulfate kinase
MNEKKGEFMQTPCCYWLTGLPAAGKSSLAYRAAELLQEAGVRCHVLDGDALRSGINKDLGFDMASRQASVRRASEVARILMDAGLVVLVSLVSPYTKTRQEARDIMSSQGRFYEVYVNANLRTCMSRDPKGLYRAAMAGSLMNMTGLDDPYEVPETPDLTINTMVSSVEEGAMAIYRHFNMAHF